MRAELAAKPRAWVIGGSGAIGGAVVRALRARQIDTVMTYRRRKEPALALAAETGARALELQLSSRDALIPQLDAELALGRPSLIVHCVAQSAALPLVELSEALWRDTLQANAESALWLAQWAAARELSPLDLVFTGGLDRSQSLPLPVHYAATQGMLAAMVMALGHELGPRGIRVNMVSLGVMDAGLSATLTSERRTDYEHFSALRRVGRAEEAAQVITWLGLENSYIQGKVIAVNGGI